MLDADQQVKEASSKINELEEKLCDILEKEMKVNKEKREKKKKKEELEEKVDKKHKENGELRDTQERYF